MLYTERDVILFLNIIRIENYRILDFIGQEIIYRFIDITETSVSSLEFLKDNEIRKIIDGLNNIDLDLEKEKLQARNIDYTLITDDDYPRKLYHIYDPPALLYYKGNLRLVDQLTLAIVGARRPSEYGLWATQEIVKQLSPYKFCIVSGMALGIDKQAHQAALDYKLGTIGVLASSVDTIYPLSNRNLYKAMDGQLLVSEFPLGTNPLKRNFVYRNRIIAGLASGVLVIEAQEKSGSLLTAKYATEQNKQLYALPGNISSYNSKGTNGLIQQGAKLIMSAKDIVEEFEYLDTSLGINEKVETDLSPFESKILGLLDDNPLNQDEIMATMQIDHKDFYKTIFELEDKGLIKKIEGDFYIRI